MQSLTHKILRLVVAIFLLFFPLRSKAQSTTHSNFLTDFLASLHHTGWYFHATALGQVLPYGIEQPYNNTRIPASEVSPLGGWGYGWVTWFNSVVVSMSINKRFYQMQQPTQDNTLTQNSGGVDFMLGYTVQRFDRIQITPTIEYGLTGYPLEQAAPNPFFHLGASLGLTYNVPFFSLHSTERNVWSDIGSLIMFNVGYVQHFSVISGNPAQTAFFIRMRLGLGVENQPMQTH